MSEKYYEPELGQLVFNKPFKTYGCPGHLEKALRVISETMEVKKTCGRKDTPFMNSGLRFKNDVFEANAYDWSECTCEGSWHDGWTQDKCKCGWLPQEYNFKWKDIEVSWYKYLGRGMSINRAVNQSESVELLNNCLESIIK